MSEVLRGEGIAVRYGGADAVRGVDVSVRAGELVALLGANGAGKTSLMLALSGHARPAAGRVFLLGQETDEPPQRRARLGLSFVGDDRHLFPSLTVRQSLRLARGAEEEALGRFPALEPLMDRPAGLLSGGEQQMLALARALGMRPKLLVVDELSLGLAPSIRDRLLALLRQLADEGLAVFVVEQAAQAVLRHADRAYVMRRGEIVDERAAAAWVGREADLAELFLS